MGFKNGDLNKAHALIGLRPPCLFLIGWLAFRVASFTYTSCKREKFYSAIDREKPRKNSSLKVGKALFYSVGAFMLLIFIDIK